VEIEWWSATLEILASSTLAKIVLLVVLLVVVRRLLIRISAPEPRSDQRG
jgi:hypothetical protein